MKVVAIAALAGLLVAGCVSRTGPPDETSSPISVELPVAADGTDTNACQDGHCEVELGAHTILIIDGTAVGVFIDAEIVTVELPVNSTNPTRITLDEPGSAEVWTNGATGRSIDVTLVGIDETVAVLKFETA